jgi:16S rRNA (adenine(1408)-N(1))-methyltransferase
VIDLGCGDGRSVLARAAAAPDTLVIGIDANAAGMARASRRPPANARFVVAAAEHPP